MRQIDLRNLKTWNTAKEVAAMLERSVRNVERLCQLGYFPKSEKAGSTWIITAGSVRAFLSAPQPKAGRPRRPGASAAPTTNSGPAGTP